MNKYIDVFKLKKGDKVYDYETDLVGVITDIREHGNENIEAFVSYQDSPEVKLNCYDTNIYLLPRES